MPFSSCKSKRQEFDSMATDGKNLLNEHTPLEETGWLGTKYFNNPKTWKDWNRPGALPFLKMKCTERNNAGIPSQAVLETTLPVHSLKDEGKLKLSNPPESNIQIMWIGHATLLVQFDGITVLTDPVFLYRCSPLQIVGPYRYRPVPCEIKDLPKIDAVIISHNHYDHLEHDAVEKLNRRFGDGLRWFVPMGMKDWFIGYGCSNVKEMTWWDSENLCDDKPNRIFHCVPAQHWSQRKPMDAMKSLWCGWVIKGTKHTFYYSGDTGYCPVFKEIGKRFGPMDLSAIPIGCYEPRYFMKPQHIGPEEAVQIHKEVNSKKSVAVHWGTFNGLGSHEPYLEPKQKLEEEARRNLPNATDFFTVKHGEIKVITPSTGHDITVDEMKSGESENFNSKENYSDNTKAETSINSNM